GTQRIDPMRAVGVFGLCTLVALLAGAATPAGAQALESDTRSAVIEEAQAEKVTALHPYVPSTGERLMTTAENIFLNPTTTWHPYLENAYHGGGLALGAGYMPHGSACSHVDLRGSYSILGYKRAEVEFVSPRLFHRRGELSVLGGWRDATKVGFYGLGPDSSSGNRANYGFEQPHGSALLTLWPTRRLLMLRGGVELSRWSLKSGTGGLPSIEDTYTPATLPGLGTTTTYLQTHATVGFDWRTSSGYARRGGFYGVTAHDYNDRDDRFGFRQ